MSHSHTKFLHHYFYAFLRVEKIISHLNGFGRTTVEGSKLIEQGDSSVRSLTKNTKKLTVFSFFPVLNDISCGRVEFIFSSVRVNKIQTMDDRYMYQRKIFFSCGLNEGQNNRI
jgi:hypothetical protein